MSFGQIWYDSIKVQKTTEALIQNAGMCPSEFIEFASRRIRAFTSHQRERVDSLLPLAIRKTGYNKENNIKAICEYVITDFQYEMARMADPDFFIDLRRYFILRKAYVEPFSNEPQNPLIPDIQKIYERSLPIVALINMGDTLLEHQYIEAVLDIQRQLSSNVVNSYEKVNRNQSSTFLNDIKLLEDFYEKVPRLLSYTNNIRMLDKLFPITRFVLTEYFLYSDGRENRLHAGYKLLMMILDKLKKQQHDTYWKQVQFLYYFTCDEKDKSPYLCDEAWQKLEALYHDMRQDPTLWNANMKWSSYQTH